ncbi:hypothetical protein [Kitasatospora sp. NBC_01266]|uniref:hypothetical protein n=1 Tax=Kitasatospora sp. NBC_01266 TaxID=2903572 RepID=UPI002E30AA02|nr:hypothetical protein [Kitasatospora sp. NBC_01266]
MAYLLPGQSMGEISYVCAGDYMFASQNDGNFVVYNNGGTAVWASNTSTGSPNLVSMVPNGNFEVTNPPRPATTSCGRPARAI